MFYVNFNNLNDTDHLRLKYKDDPTVIAMLDKIKELQEELDSVD